MAAKITLHSSVESVPKRRSWRSGKHQYKKKYISIDNMDVVKITNPELYIIKSEDLQHPELMNCETLIYHLARMKIIYPNEKHSRERLLYLFRTYVLPQPQRQRIWCRKGEKNVTTAMEVECNHDQWISRRLDKNCNSVQSLGKRKLMVDDKTPEPLAKRLQCTGSTQSPIDLPEISESEQNVVIRTKTTKKVIKIRRKSSSHKTEPVNM